MTLLFIDGGDDGLVNLGKYDFVGSGQDYGGSGRNGAGISMRLLDSSRGYIKKILDPADEHATLIVGHAFRASTAGDPSPWQNGAAQIGGIAGFFSDAGVTQHIAVGFVYDRTIRVCRGNMGGTVLADYAMPVPNWTDWLYFEVKCTLSDTVGVVEVRMNGQVIINLTNIDTKNAGTKTVFDSFGVSGNQVANGVHNLMRDLYCCNGAGSVNNNFLGDVTVETLYPSGDGSSSQFTGSDGNSVNNSLLVDEPNTVITTDYVEDSVSGHKDLYAIANLARTSGPIYGVQVTDHLVNTDSGAVSAKVSLKSGSTAAAGPAVPLVTAYKTARKLWEQNPDTSAPWDVTTVNAIEAGVEVV